MSGRPTALLETVNLLLNQGPLLTLGLSSVFGGYKGNLQNANLCYQM